MPDMRPRVLVLGATGLLGRPVTVRLVEAGLDVRALARDVPRARALLPDACAIVPGDLRDAASLDAALRGADAVYLSLSNAMRARRPAWDADTDGTRLVIERAKAAGVRRVLRLSALGVEPPEVTWWVAAAKRETDAALAASGLDHTIFRPTWFMESIAICALGPLLLRPPAPDDPIWWVAADDFGRQVAAALRDERSIGVTYEVQGPEPVSMREAFARFRRIWRGRLAPVPLPRLAVTIGSRVVGPTAYLRELLHMTYTAVVRVPAEVNGHELHRPTTTIEDFARGLRSARHFPTKSIA
jgi:uncharacterized protein YbjT (DUF2867 family)